MKPLNIRIQRLNDWARSPARGCGAGCGDHLAERRRAGRVQPLGVMSYLPVATAAYIERYLADGFTRRAEATGALTGLELRRRAPQDMLVRKSFGRQPSPGRHISFPLLRGSPVRYMRAWAGACFPEQLAAAELANVLVRADNRRAGRCAAFLAMLEAGQPDRRSHDITQAVRSAAADLRRRPTAGAPGLNRPECRSQSSPATEG